MRGKTIPSKELYVRLHGRRRKIPEYDGSEAGENPYGQISKVSVNDLL